MKRLLPLILLLAGTAGAQGISGSRGNSTNDFYLDIARGQVGNMSVVHKFGRNDAVGGSWEFVSELSSATAFLEAATAVRVKAGNAADTAAGAGCREVTVTGIDSTLAEVSEAMATAGLSASSPTTATFWRVYRAYCSASGDYGKANTAAVVIENSGGGTDLISIAVEEGQSQYGGFTVPTGQTAYVMSIELTVDGAKNADIRMMQRRNITDVTAPVSSVRVVQYFDGVSGEVIVRPQAPFGPYPALTDLWFEAKSASGAEVSVDFEILLDDD